MSITGVSLFLALLLGTAGCEASKAVDADEYHERVDACDLLDERTMVELSERLSKASRVEPTKQNVGARDAPDVSVIGRGRRGW